MRYLLRTKQRALYRGANHETVWDGPIWRFLGAVAPLGAPTSSSGGTEIPPPRGRSAHDLVTTLEEGCDKQGQLSN